MTKLRLTLSCGPYELTRALVEGEVQPEGIELEVLPFDPMRIYSLRRHAEVDVGELNVTEFFRGCERGLPLVGLPVFPHRRFRLGYVFVDPHRGITEARQLNGQRVAVEGVTPAAGVWIKGMLQDHHGLDLSSVEWHENPLEPVGDDPPPPERTRVTEQLLLDGEVDALISPLIPRSFAAGDERIARLFPDYKEQDVAYYRETGIFPIMHVVTVSRDILEREPWVAASIVAAFDEAKRIGWERVSNPRLTPLAFFEHTWEEERRLLGPDPWQTGLGDANRHNLQTVIRHTREQGRVAHEPALDELFA
jgi:4,5-dihydroxyphthalate decarboxylase